jgi:lysophospholipase L1-like esterase
VLGHGGATVVIATVPPVVRANLPVAVDPRQRADCLNRIYRDVARSHPRTTVLDVSEWACPEARCLTEAEGAPLRADGVHFEATGATLLADWALPKMLGTGGAGRGDGGRDHLSVLVAGDSTALVLAHRFPAANHPRLALTEATALGCGITRGQAVSGDRAMPADCDGTRARYRQTLSAGHPAVVVLMAGAWEVFDHRVDGVTHRFGTAEWEAIVREGLATYVTEAAAAGARVVMLTAPCFHEATDPRFPTPERNDHERVDAYNRLVRQVAAADAAVTSVVDYGARVCRDGRPTAELGDGVHLTPEGAARTWAWLAPQLF